MRTMIFYLKNLVTKEFLQTLSSTMYYAVSVRLTASDSTLGAGKTIEPENKKIQIKIEDGKYVEILADNKEDADLLFHNALAKNFCDAAMNRI